MSGPSKAESCPAPAFRSPAAIIVFVIIVAAALAGDLASKQYVFDSILADPTYQSDLARAKAYNPELTARAALSYFRRDVLPGVQFTLSTNKGVAFGMPIPRLLVACITVAAVGFVGYFFATSPAGARFVHVALAMILAGAGGNLYDRLFSKVTVTGFEPIQYQVRDFIDCSGLHYPWIFNVADAYLVAGVAILMLHMIAAHRKQATATSEG